ncbi:MAG: hypothetical protein ACLT3G_11355 [Acutalibacteraceae bacterium]
MITERARGGRRHERRVCGQRADGERAARRHRDAVLFFASGLSDYITGAFLSVSGGRVMPTI